MTRIQKSQNEECWTLSPNPTNTPKDKTYIWVSVWWKTKIYTTHIHWVTRGTGTPKDKDEVNKRDVCECDGWVRVFETIDTHQNSNWHVKIQTWWEYSRLLLSGWPKHVNLTVDYSTSVSPRKCKTELLKLEKKRSVSRWSCKNNSLMNSLCNLPDVLGIGDIKETTFGKMLERVFSFFQRMTGIL